MDFLAEPLFGPNTTRRGEAGTAFVGRVGCCELLSFGGMELDRSFKASFLVPSAPCRSELIRSAIFLGLTFE
jgi:hypothetical protein